MKASGLTRLLGASDAYDEGDMFDASGTRRPLSQLIAMSKVAGIWSLLSDEERTEVTESTGQLANARPYISRKLEYAPAIRKNVKFVINASGERIRIT